MTETSPQTGTIRPEEIADALAKDQAAGKISIIDEDHLLTYPEDGSEPIEVSTENYIRSFDRFSQAHDGVIMQAKAEFFYQSQEKTLTRFLSKPLKSPTIARSVAATSVSIMTILLMLSLHLVNLLLGPLKDSGPTAIADFWGKVSIVGNIVVVFGLMVYGFYYAFRIRKMITEDHFKVGIEYTPIEGAEDSIKNLRPVVINIKPTTVGQFLRTCWIFAWRPLGKLYLTAVTFYMVIPWGLRLIESI